MDRVGTEHSFGTTVLEY